MRIIMLGPPGVGKGTISQMLVKRFKAVQISTGDLLRKAVKDGTTLGKKAKVFMDKGGLVPDEIVIKLLRENIKGDSYILDGFPRRVAQAKALEKERIGIQKVVNLTAPDNVIVRRLSSRRTCSSCKAIYNLVSMRPKVRGRCDACGGRLIQREDDKPGSIRHRLVVYHKETEPLIRFYEKKGILLHVDGSYPDPKVVYKGVLLALKRKGNQ